MESDSRPGSEKVASHSFEWNARVIRVVIRSNQFSSSLTRRNRLMSLAFAGPRLDTRVSSLSRFLQ